VKEEEMKNMGYKSLWIKALAFLVAFSISGCAGYSITKDGQGVGYDVYRPEPYLLVKNGDKGPEASILWLPNFTQRYRISTWNFLGKADFEFDLTDGWRLTKISDKSDNTTIASKLLDIVEKATKSATIALTGSVELFRLEYNKEGEFVGMRQVSALPAK
jgi:hypothetical protein